MRRVMTMAAVGVLLAGMSAACLADPGSFKFLPNESSGDVYPIVTVPVNMPPAALHPGEQMCAAYVMSVDAHGNAENVRIWSHFPRRATRYARAGQAVMRKWLFHPHFVDGKPVATNDFFMVISYEVHYEESKQQRNSVLGSHIMSHHTEHVSDEQATLRWLCSQAPMHGVSIVATAGAPQPAWDDDSGMEANPVARIAADSLPADARAGKVRVRFCIDDQGRVADATVLKSSPHGVYDEAALQALGATRFTVRKIHDSAVESCGLMVWAKFSGGREGKVGRLGNMTFNNLKGSPPVPKLVAQKPVRISLSIPAGTPLPKVAKVELRMCIEKSGKVSGASVVQADPPQYFDKAALETVSGWRFARPRRRMCDVYQSVQFPLGH